MKTTMPFIFYFFLIIAVSLTFQHCSLWEPEVRNAPCPVITSFSPSGAAFNAIVTVTGRNFHAGLPELHMVRIGDVVISEENIEVPDSTTILVKIPKGLGNGKISVSLITATQCPAVSESEFVYYYTATMVETIAGEPRINDMSCNTCLNAPSGMDWDASGNIVVADKSNTVVRKVNTNTGGFIQTHGVFRVPGCNPTSVVSSANANFRAPIDVAADASGTLYVAEANNNVIRRINSSNNVDVFAGACQDGSISVGTIPCSNVRLGTPAALVKDGNIFYLVNSGGLRRIDASCSVSSVLNSDANTYLSAVTFSESRPGVGPIFVGDERATVKIKSVNDSGVATALPMSNNLLDKPADLLLDNKGNIFVTDRGKHQIFILYTNNELVLLAGTGGEADFFDGVSGLSAKFNTPWGILLDEDRNELFVADSGNHVIRKIKLE